MECPNCEHMALLPDDGEIYFTAGNEEKPKADDSLEFVRKWKNAATNPPKESGRYWCVVEEIAFNDPGVSHFQWVYSYNAETNSWADTHFDDTVVWWTELGPSPSI